MKITKLSLTNFRSFKETQTINFAPVTLLFGPNSVGKSTVLMALFYLQQILEKGQCDPQRLDALGNKFVGGFKNLVHGRDLQKSIKIKVEYEKPGIGVTYQDASEAVPEVLTQNDPDYVCIFMPEVMAESETIAIEIEIAWSFSQNTAYVRTYKVWLNEEFIAEINSDNGLKNPIISDINYLHPLLGGADDDWLEYMYEMAAGPFHIKHKARIASLRPDFVNEDFDENFDKNGVSTRFESELGSVPMAIPARAGALPWLGKRLKLDFRSDVPLDIALANDIYSEILVAPLDNLNSLLSSSMCIGPLRHIPDATYQPNPYPQQCDWYTGKACWDQLYLVEQTTALFVNSWLKDKGKLDLGYQLVFQVEEGTKRFVACNQPQTLDDAWALKDALADKMQMSLSKEDAFINPDTDKIPFNIDMPFPDKFVGKDFTYQIKFNGKEITNTFSSNLYVGGETYKTTKVTLWDINNMIEVNASDIGVGVSQLLPLVVAAVTTKKGFVSCEQPELHVHPRVQVAIGDLLTQANDKANFLIETHSEHLILRLLRRIRETTDDELPEGMKPVKPEDISIVYIESSDNGVVVKNIEVDDEGEFKERWPQGFFSERRGELF